jgi:hypothetical protein
MYILIRYDSSDAPGDFVIISGYTTHAQANEVWSALSEKSDDNVCYFVREVVVGASLQDILKWQKPSV